ncbi:hypothetical protein E0H26_06925 [Micromonospora zingiberis]|uniref:Peptidase MA-like domain-containing protein n=1 Tax=Micromonospora zingiberis TaxID=2053011 RepID=A0A4R0GUP0_9ACTN|nr:hypothetical protein E0H26_06925 [Micromonospora zingiberis]
MPAGNGRRRRWPLWAALVAVVLVLSCGVPAALLVGGFRDAGGGEPSPSASVTENPTTVAARQVAERIKAQLDKQSAALLGGDRAGFLEIAQPAAHKDLRGRYAALRALKVTRWEGHPSGLPTTAARPGEWRLPVEFRYCFVLPQCQTSPVVIETRWRDGAQPRLLALGRSKTSPYVVGRMNGQPGNLPWELSELVSAVGKRTMVATTPAYRHRLPGLLKRAEAAAKVADSYTATGAAPDRYRIFYAGPKEWKRWYGGEQPSWGAGYAINVGGGHYEIVLGPESFEYGPYLDELLRHELAHAASLPEKDYTDESTWWLTEGLAEQAGADGRPVRRYEGLAETRRLVRGDWNGKLDTLSPDHDTSDERVAGSYGIAYLAVRYLVDRFGEERVLAFVKAVVHDLRIPRQTSEEIFDEKWADLHKACVAYIRSAVR